MKVLDILFIISRLVIEPWIYNFYFIQQLKKWRSGELNKPSEENKRDLSPLDPGIQNLKNELLVSDSIISTINFKGIIQSYSTWNSKVRILSHNLDIKTSIDT